MHNFKDFLRPILEKAVGKEQYESGVETVFDALQNPVINKQVRLFQVLCYMENCVKPMLFFFQLAMFLFDIALAELFPELPVEHDNDHSTKW